MTTTSDRWLAAETARWAATWPTGHEDEPTREESALLAFVADRADARGVAHLPLGEVVESVGLRPKEVSSGWVWLRWRGSILGASRVSEPDEPRIDRVRLKNWPSGR